MAQWLRSATPLSAVRKCCAARSYRPSARSAAFRKKNEKTNRRLPIPDVRSGRLEVRRVPQERSGEETALRIPSGRGTRRGASGVGTGQRRGDGVSDVLHHARKLGGAGTLFGLENIGWRGTGRDARQTRRR